MEIGSISRDTCGRRVGCDHRTSPAGGCRPETRKHESTTPTATPTPTPTEASASTCENILTAERLESLVAYPLQATERPVSIGEATGELAGGVLCL